MMPLAGSGENARDTNVHARNSANGTATRGQRSGVRESSRNPSARANRIWESAMEIRIAIADANARPTASFPVTELPTNPPVSQLRYKSEMLHALLAFLLAASLNVHDLSGSKVQLRDYRGKSVVLNFWATWCVPCREEMPMMVEAAKSWTPRGVTFIAVSLDDEKTKKDIPAFVARYGITFPVWVGGSADTLDKFH